MPRRCCKNNASGGCVCSLDDNNVPARIINEAFVVIQGPICRKQHKVVGFLVLRDVNGPCTWLILMQGAEELCLPKLLKNVIEWHRWCHWALRSCERIFLCQLCNHFLFLLMLISERLACKTSKINISKQKRQSLEWNFKFQVLDRQALTSPYTFRSLWTVHDIWCEKTTSDV